MGRKKDKDRENLIISLFKKHGSYSAVARIVKISRQRVHQIVNGKGYKTPKTFSKFSPAQRT